MHHRDAEFHRDKVIKLAAPVHSWLIGLPSQRRHASPPPNQLVVFAVQNVIDELVLRLHFGEALFRGTPLA